MRRPMSERQAAAGTVTFRLNGKPAALAVEPREKLVDALREQARLTGTHIGCETGACGACHVLLDGRMVRACLVLAAQADGLEVTTIEGLAEDATTAALREAFIARNALQCGFCTPGMLIAAGALLKENPAPDRATIRLYLTGNICRCTGYHAIVDAVAEAASALRRERDIG